MLNHVINSTQPDQNLLGLVEQGFSGLNGCILLTSQIQSASSISLNDIPDCTGYECFVNHIHIGNVLDDSQIKPTILLEQGLALAYELQKRLVQFSPSARFKIIVSFDNEDCSVRFHKVRNGEDWLAPNIDKYEEGILILET
jgi:hypothetical protein